MIFKFFFPHFYIIILIHKLLPLITFFIQLIVIKMALFKLMSVSEKAFLNLNTKYWSLKHSISSKINEIELDMLGIPPKPTRPKGPYLKYFVDSYKSFKGKNVAEAAAIISDKWKNLPENEKMKYFEEYKQKKLEYNKNLIAYQNSLTESQKDKIKIFKEKLKKIKQNTNLRRDLENKLNKPQKPLNTFIRFALEKNFNRNNLPEITEEWRNMSETEKKKYRYEYEEEHEKYITEKKKWEKEMIQEGNYDALTQDVLKGLKKIM